MDTTDLERQLLAEFFRRTGGDSAAFLKSADEIAVSNRVATEKGFITEFGRHECLRVTDDKQNHESGDIQGVLNEARIDVGFLFYVREGYLEAIEGHTYGAQPWPDDVTCCQLW